MQLGKLVHMSPLMEIPASVSSDKAIRRIEPGFAGVPRNIPLNEHGILFRP